MSDHIPDDDPNAPYTERMCRAVDRSFMAAFREGQKLERELMESRAEAARLREALEQVRSMAHGDADKTICLINLSAIQRVATIALKKEETK